ncbi:cytidine deaminase [Mycobacterium paraense]|uniref:cytidine deaminase n=1 Tax=Mycobacterium paraense TaxID=767916 RepID=UPI000A14BAAD|nr:cytidine deaminase [Mycobacterium paraense]
MMNKDARDGQSDELTATHTSESDLLRRDPNIDAHRLCEAAGAVALRAYAPYSHFRVGAAVQVDDQIFVGANIENATFGATVCAERIALANAKIADVGTVRALALHFPDADSDAPITSMVPCGICRQWLTELYPECLVIICQRNRVFTMRELLPNPFVL